MPAHPALEELGSSLEAKAEEFKDVVKSGRTHLMDATPVMLGQEFGGYAAVIGWASSAGVDAPPRCRAAAGGTAVGTGINAPEVSPSA